MHMEATHASAAAIQTGVKQTAKRTCLDKCLYTRLVSEAGRYLIVAVDAGAAQQLFPDLGGLG